MPKFTLSPQFIRFAGVGLINTIVDTAIFVSLREAGLTILWANIISTSVGLTVSLILNYRFTFKTTGRLSPAKIVAYIGITLAGLWVLQPLVITGLTAANGIVDYVGFFAQLIGNKDLLEDIIPKLGSVAVTLVWNYLWYSRVIFKDKTTAAKTALAQE